MSSLPESTRNDLRRIGGELSRLSFELLTVVGLGFDDEDEIQQKRITEAMDLVDQAAQNLADIITNEPDDVEELVDETES